MRLPHRSEPHWWDFQILISKVTTEPQGRAPEALGKEVCKEYAGKRVEENRNSGGSLTTPCSSCPGGWGFRGLCAKRLLQYFGFAFQQMISSPQSRTIWLDPGAFCIELQLWESFKAENGCSFEVGMGAIQAQTGSKDVSNQLLLKVLIFVMCHSLYTGLPCCRYGLL